MNIHSLYGRAGLHATAGALVSHRSARNQGPEGVGMDWDDAVPFAIMVAAFVLALKAVFAVRRVRVQLAELTEKFGVLDHRLVGIEERFDRFAATPGAVAPGIEPAAPAAPAPAELPEEPAA